MIKFEKTRDQGNEYDLTDIFMCTDHIAAQDLLDEFANFLRACGYVLPNVDHPIVFNEEEE